MGEREKERNRERENCKSAQSVGVCIYLYRCAVYNLLCAVCCSRCRSAKCMCRRSCRFTETRRFGSGGGVREVVVVEKVEEGGLSLIHI